MKRTPIWLLLPIAFLSFFCVVALIHLLIGPRIRVEPKLPPVVAVTPESSEEPASPTPPPVIPAPAASPAEPPAPAASPLRPGATDTAATAAASTNGRKPLSIAAAIERDINQKISSSSIKASPVASDAEFLRRISLDLTGKIPTAEKAAAFLDSTDPAKRSKLIDELLASDSYGSNFAWYWRDLLVKRDPDNRNLPNQDVFVKWIADQFNKNKPWSATVKAMLTATGSESSEGATFFVMANQDMQLASPNKITGTAAALFLGLQLQCAECHTHPTVKEWSQQDFWGMAAFFNKTRIARESAQKGRPVNGSGNVTEEPPPARQLMGKKAPPAKVEQPPGLITIPDPTDPNRTMGVARAKLFEQPKPATLPKSGEHRPVVADWLTSDVNPYFARATVNRMWAYFFARGFVNPLDDFRPDSVASHPELLRSLSDELVAANFDLKHLIRCICNSQAYQRTSRPVPENETDETLFSHMTVKVITARMLLDSLQIVTGQGYEKSGGKMAGGKRGELNAGAVGFFDARDYDEIPSDYTYGIPQILKMLNGPLTKSCDDFAKRLVASEKDQTKAIEKLYLTALSRRPTEVETKRIAAFVAKSSDSTKGYSGALWALLNGAEFVCNR